MKVSLGYHNFKGLSYEFFFQAKPGYDEYVILANRSLDGKKCPIWVSISELKSYTRESYPSSYWIFFDLYESEQAQKLLLLL